MKWYKKFKYLCTRFRRELQLYRRENCGQAGKPELVQSRVDLQIVVRTALTHCREAMQAGPLGQKEPPRDEFSLKPCLWYEVNNEVKTCFDEMEALVPMLEAAFKHIKLPRGWRVIQHQGWQLIQQKIDVLRIWGFKLTSVEKVRNKRLAEQHEDFKKRLPVKFQHTEHFFHGTGENAALNIAKEGFGVKASVVNAFGCGIYGSTHIGPALSFAKGTTSCKVLACQLCTGAIDFGTSGQDYYGWNADKEKIMTLTNDKPPPLSKIPWWKGTMRCVSQQSQLRVDYILNFELDNEKIMQQPDEVGLFLWTFNSFFNAELRNQLKLEKERKQEKQSSEQASLPAASKPMASSSDASRTNALAVKHTTHFKPVAPAKTQQSKSLSKDTEVPSCKWCEGDYVLIQPPIDFQTKHRLPSTVSGVIEKITPYEEETSWGSYRPDFMLLVQVTLPVKVKIPCKSRFVRYKLSKFAFEQYRPSKFSGAP